MKTVYWKIVLKSQGSKQGKKKRQVKSQHFRLASQKIEAEYVSTAVHKVYGGRISLRQHDKQRMKQYFMSVPDAKNRALKNKEKIEKGLKKPKDHVGSLSSYEIDTHKLDSEALAWTPENPPNFQSLGKDCIKSKKRYKSKTTLNKFLKY